jgi:heme/copper-type cytochrome/quinol oxidase subunit 2
VISFIVVLAFTLLSVLYVNRLIKYKFNNEKRANWKKIHIIAYISVYIPLLIVLYLVWTDFIN